MNTHTFGMLECEVQSGDEWYFHGNEVVVRDSSGKGVILVGRCDCDHDRANANRIVACVNACAGMADPASEIAALKAQRDELLAALGVLKELAKCVRNEDEYGGSTMDDALIDADEILAKYAPASAGGAA